MIKKLSKVLAVIFVLLNIAIFKYPGIAKTNEYCFKHPDLFVYIILTIWCLLWLYFIVLAVYLFVKFMNN
jgi:hypothetical protein